MTPPPRATLPEVPRTSIRAIYLFTAAGTAVWLAAIFLAPLLAAKGSGRTADFIYALFSPLCHQRPERCFFLAGRPLAVCGRCLGIYAGFAAGLVLYPLLRGFSKLSLPSRRQFLLMTLPMVVDAGAGILGFWASPIGLRFTTGLIWGSLLPFYFITGVADFLTTRRIRRAGRAIEKPPEKS